MPLIADITVPFTTSRLRCWPAEVCQVIFTYQQVRHVLVAESARWSGGKRDQEANRLVGVREHLEFRIGRLSGPFESVVALQRAYGNVLTVANAPTLFMDGRAGTVYLEGALLTVMGPTVRSGAMAVVDGVQGFYLDGRWARRNFAE